MPRLGSICILIRSKGISDYVTISNRIIGIQDFEKVGCNLWRAVKWNKGRVIKNINVVFVDKVLIKLMLQVLECLRKIIEGAWNFSISILLLKLERIFIHESNCNKLEGRMGLA